MPRQNSFMRPASLESAQLWGLPTFFTESSTIEVDSQQENTPEVLRIGELAERCIVSSATELFSVKRFV